MNFDFTQGDPAIELTEDGADLTFKGGQPVMDQGLENAALISLFTAKGWWGNTLFPDVNQQIGSDYEKSTFQSITLTVIQRIQAAAESALNWMVDSGLASRIKAVVKNTSTGRIEVGVAIDPPSNDLTVLIATRHGGNWVAQRDDPAHRRLS